MALGFASALAGAGSELATAVVRVAYDDRAVEAGLARTEGRLASSQSKMGGLFGKIGIGVGILGIASAKMAADFEHNLGRIEALVGASADDMEMYKGAIHSLSVETGKSAKELGDALYFVTSSGFEGAEALDVLEISAKAAAAGLGETMVIADAVTSAVNAYGSEALTAAQATDILTAAVRLGKGEPEELARSIGQVMSIAQEMGVEFDEVAAAIASYTLSGNTARRTSFALRALLVGLLRPNKQVTNAFKEIGWSVQGFKKAVADEGLLPALDQLRDKAGANEEVFARTIAQGNALALVLKLIGPSAQQNAEIFDAVANSTGETEKAFGIMHDTVTSKAHRSISGFTSILTQLGEGVLPAVGIGLGGLAAVLGFIAGQGTALQILGETIVFATGAFLAYKGAMLAAAAATAIYEAWVLRAEIAQLILNKTMKANPILLIVSLLAMLGFALVEAYRHSETFRRVVHQAFKLTGDIVSKVVKIITFQLSLILAGFSGLARAASKLPFIGDHFKGVADAIDLVRDGLDAAIRKIDELGEKDGTEVDVNVNVNEKHTVTFEDVQAGQWTGRPTGSTAGTTTTGGGDGPPTPTGVGDSTSGRFKTPVSIQQERADARRTRETNRDDIEANKHEIGFLKWVLRTKQVTAAERLDITNRIADLEDDILSMEESNRARVERARADAESERQDAARERERAARDRKAKAEADARAASDAHAATLLTPQRLLLRQAKARRDADLKNDIAAYRAEAAWIKKRIRQGDLTAKELTDLWNRFYDTQERIRNLREQQRDRKKKKDKQGGTGEDATNARKQIAEFMANFMQFQSEYGPNFFAKGSFGQWSNDMSAIHPEWGMAPGVGARGAGGKTVSITQNFPAPPTDQYKETIYAYNAAKSVMDG